MNNTVDIIRKVQYDFDNEALGILKANEEWSEYQKNKEILQKELENKLEKIDPKLKDELRNLIDLYTSVECVELEVYFEKAFKEGVRFLVNCL